MFLICVPILIKIELLQDVFLNHEIDGITIWLACLKLSCYFPLFEVLLSHCVCLFHVSQLFQMM